MLEMVVQSENVGITPGAVIAKGFVDMASFELFTKTNAVGKFQQKRKFGRSPKENFKEGCRQEELVEERRKEVQ